MDDVDWSSLHKVLGEITRRSILELLAEKEALNYTDIMTLLRVTNTGRLNYHLKALGGLISKDDNGKYHLTERGQLAVNLLHAFPERVTLEKKHKSALRTATAVVLVLAGILLISSALLLFVSAPTTIVSSTQTSISNLAIPQNTTVSLTSFDILSNASPLSIAWSAYSPVYIYVINTTQHDALLLQYATNGQVPTTLENFSGTPTSWVSQYDLQAGSISLNLPQGQYYFFASSATQTILDTFTLAQQQQAAVGPSPSPLEYLPALALGTLGTLLIILAVSILTRRVWR